MTRAPVTAPQPAAHDAAHDDRLGGLPASRRLLLTKVAVRRLERQALAAVPEGTLMRRAASAVARCCAALLASRRQGAPVVVLVGHGNNGADALLTGLMLYRSGWPVSALTTMPLRSDAASGGQPAATGENRHFVDVWLRAAGRDPDHLQIEHAAELDAASLSTRLDGAALIIDGLFGIGLSRPVDGVAASLIELANRASSIAGCPLVAIDVPSGLDPDRGTPVDDFGDGTVIQATHTVTMIADKPGLHTGIGRQCAGRVIVADLQLPCPPAESMSVDEAGELLRGCPSPGVPSRAIDSHKGSHGTLLIIGGAQGMAGAALLAAGGAQATGIGKLAISSPDEPVFASNEPQWMTREWRRFEPAPTAIVIGCGLGQTIRAVDGVADALGRALPLVLDADALALIAARPALRSVLLSHRAPRVLTPHPLEAARLLGMTTADVQRDRIAAAHRLALELDSVVILKGAGSIVADALGWAIVDAGTPILATAGTGDVLAGVVGALLAQGLGARSAARIGCWLHARAGDYATRDFPSSIGLRAADLPAYLRQVINAEGTVDNVDE